MKFIKACFIALILLGLLPSWVLAQTQVPALSGRVIDATQTLSAEQVSELSNQLQALEQQTGAQLVVLMVPSTQPEDIAAYAQRVGEAWKLGRAQVGDGLLMVVAKNDRRANIQVAKALEGAIPDLAAAHIIQTQMAPAFKQGNYAAGLRLGIEALGQRIQKENLAPPVSTPLRHQPHKLGVPFADLLPLLAIAFVMALVIGRRFGVLPSGLLAGVIGTLAAQSLIIGVGLALLAMVLVLLLFRRTAGSGWGTSHSTGPLIFGGGGGSWGGSSNGTGGGFSSGGGGDFGGGGASGDW